MALQLLWILILTQKRLEERAGAASTQFERDHCISLLISGFRSPISALSWIAQGRTCRSTGSTLYDRPIIKGVLRSEGIISARNDPPGTVSRILLCV